MLHKCIITGVGSRIDRYSVVLRGLRYQKGRQGLLQKDTSESKEVPRMIG